MRGNQISEIKGLKKLIELRHLNLSENLITEIKGLNQLTKLIWLQLNLNQLTEIKGLEQLKQLITLLLDYNKIKEIKGLEQLKQLKVIFLYNNLITELPEYLLELGQQICWETDYGKWGIYVKDNPFTSPSPEIIKQGNRAIQDYFNQRNNTRENLLNKSKFIFPIANQVSEFQSTSTPLKAFISYSKFDGESNLDNINYLEEFKQALAPLSKFNNLLKI